VLLQQPGSRFVVLGEGPDLPAMKGAVSAAGLDRNFAFRGYQPREALKEAYEAMEVLVLPSRREGLPLSLLEACAMGVCVAAFSVGGIPEVIVHGQNGLLAQPGDTGDLAAQIVALRQDTQLAARLRSQARATVVSHFGIRTQVRQLESVYAEVLGSGPPRNPDRPVPKS
jgi:glycosyltransferase involved in cell wall biosynthesis